MRKLTEPTARNLLRAPLVLGVSLTGLIALSFSVLAIFVLIGNSGVGNLISIGCGVVGYVGLRGLNRFARVGWEESLIFPLERALSRKLGHCQIRPLSFDFEILSPDTIEPIELINHKESLLETVQGIRSGQRLTLHFAKTGEGGSVREIRVEGRTNLKNIASVNQCIETIVGKYQQTYSLCRLPTTTDPTWLFNILSKLDCDFGVVLTLRGIAPLESKRRIEHSRRSNSLSRASVSDIDAEVTFEEASQVLEGISRGDDGVIEASLIITSQEPINLDPSLFCKEKDSPLALTSALGLRSRMHRSHWVRHVTATDLIPSVFDAKEPGAAILKTPRGLPLYFSPQDPRLEALHWLVVGASGSGKSFFTGLVLKRMVERGVPMSVLFIDHNRSFRRLVRSQDRTYCEAASLTELKESLPEILHSLNKVGTLAGVELSDLALAEKKSAVHWLLSQVESFLRNRESVHPIYLVLDECWNFLRDEPVLVQRAFREFRKLNGAVVAITQSLGDFLSDPSGQSILQNAPIRVLLRQGEDLTPYRSCLNLNSVEMEKARGLKQKKGVFSECLIKTPYLSRIGRLFPTESEHGMLRTDNIRQEMIQESKADRSREVNHV